MTKPLLCIKCKYLIKGIDNKTNHSCSAFPNGIPIEILNGSVDHTKPLPGQDNNIIYEPV